LFIIGQKSDFLGSWRMTFEQAVIRPRCSMSDSAIYHSLANQVLSHYEAASPFISRWNYGKLDGLLFKQEALI
jgi:hypothetical protein